MVGDGTSGSGVRFRVRPGYLLLACLVWVLAWSPAARAEVGPPAFGTGATVDTVSPLTQIWPALAISCPSSTTCVELFQRGDDHIEAETTTTADAAGPPAFSTPTDTSLIYPSALGAGQRVFLACPTTTLCVALGTAPGPDDSDPSGDVYAVRSVDGGHTWGTRTLLASNFGRAHTPGGAICTPSGRTCTLFDDTGTDWTSHDQGQTWAQGSLHPADFNARTDTPVVIDSGACFGTESCVVDGSFNAVPVALSTTDADDASPSWTKTKLPLNTFNPTGIACGPDGVCMDTDGGDNVAISTDAAASSPTWTAFDDNDDTDIKNGDSLESEGCASDDTCVIYTKMGKAIVVTHMSTSPTFTVESTGDKTSDVDTIACPSATSCILAGSRENGYGQLNLTSPLASTWTAAQVGGSNPVFDLGCSPNGRICTAIDGEDRALTTGDGGVTWSVPESLPNPFTGQTSSCTNDGTCVLTLDGSQGGSQGTLFVATGVATGNPTWTGSAISAATTFVTMTCPSSSVCVAVTTSGAVWSTTDPSDPSAWSAGPVIPGNASLVISSLSCSSASLCVAGGSVGASTQVSVSTSPTTSWSVPATIETNAAQLTALSCDAASRCVAGDNKGNVLWSPDPALGPSSWSSPVSTGDATAVIDLACTSAVTGFCTGLSADGAVLFGPSVTAANTWSPVSGAPAGLASITCSDSQLSCVSADAIGDVFAGAMSTGAAHLSAASLSFGASTVGSSVAQAVTVTNTGGAPLDISSASLSGASAFSAAGDSCEQVRLIPGATCVVQVRFGPTMTGNQTGTLTVASDDLSGPSTVSLSGSGVAPATQSAPPARTTPPPSTGARRPGKPSVKIALGGMSKARPKLTLSARAGSDAPGLRQVRITLPSGLSFAGATSARAKEIVVRAQGRMVQAAISGAGRTITIRLAKAASTVTVTVAKPAIIETGALAARVTHHRVKQLKLTLRLADTKGAATTLTAAAKV